MTTSNINRPPRIYINLPMVKDLVGTYSADELTEKAFKVKGWMERNPKNENLSLPNKTLQQYTLPKTRNIFNKSLPRQPEKNNQKNKITF